MDCRYSQKFWYTNCKVRKICVSVLSQYGEFWQIAGVVHPQSVCDVCHPQVVIVAAELDVPGRGVRTCVLPEIALVVAEQVGEVLVEVRSGCLEY